MSSVGKVDEYYVPVSGVPIELRQAGIITPLPQEPPLSQQYPLPDPYHLFACSYKGCRTEVRSSSIATIAPNPKPLPAHFRAHSRV